MSAGLDDYRIEFVTVGGVRLRLAVTGTGPPLMFLFGSGGAGTIDNAKPFVDRFSKYFSVACPDQRGLGQSDIPAGPWSMSDYAADSFGLADHLGWDTFSVIGISFGGMVGLEMAATAPDRIDRMVVWGASPGGDAHSYPLHELDGLPADERLARFAEIMDTRLDGRWGVGEPTPEAQLVQAVLERGGSPWSVAPGRDESRNAGLALQLEARRGHDVVDRLGRITCPVFVGAGTYDGLAPVRNAEVMQAGLPNCELKVYDAGHFFYLTAKAFSDSMEFLNGPTPVGGVGRRSLTSKQAAARLQGLTWT